uniref:Cytochrome P450, family 2, subfamily X, polypeptide 9 n=1 Tax=Astatotilapia calliptera TaxID=8154 RepID=A0AAX7V5X4_ASTCA
MLISVLLLWLCIFFIILQLKSRRPKNFPPGPPILPLLGNILQLRLENPLKDFERVRKHLFSPLCATKLVVGVIMADYGSSWKEHRRFALTTLRNFGLGKNSMEDRIHKEIKHIISTLEESVGKTMSPRVMFHNAASNIICQVLFATRYEYDHALIQFIVRCFTENTRITNGPWAMLYDSLPLIRYLPLPFRKVFNNAERGNDGSSFSETQLLRFTLDLYFAGTDTTSNTLLTGFLYLVNYPHIQEQCQEEIDRVLEGKDQASFEDRHKMPYMQAVIHEIQRVANTVPLSVFHCTTKDTELMGYSIPKGTMIIENLTSVLSEEGQWKFPHEFNPENFLDDKGEFVKPEAFMPFSAGPRVCLGEGLARMELFLIMVTLLRKFKFIWPEDAGEPDFTPVYGVTLTPKPYRMKVQLRTPQRRCADGH